MRIGIDLGGTKIEIMALDDIGHESLRHRVPTPHSGYDEIYPRRPRSRHRNREANLGQKGSVGVAIPGAISPKTGLVKNANSTRLIGHPLDRDLSMALNRTVRVANDANCFALSEATDGAGKGYDVVFGIIAGTGVGGGICVGGRALNGPHAIAGGMGPQSPARATRRRSPQSARMLLRQAWLHRSLVQRPRARCRFQTPVRP